MNPPGPVLLILVGLPGAGKTTFAFRLWRENPERVIRVCLDDLILMASFYGYRKELEGFYGALEKLAILKGLKQGYIVVVDRTNLTREIRERFIRLAQSLPSVRLQAVYFPISPEEALRRRREDPFLALRERFTGPVRWEEVIARMARALEPPSLEEGFHELWVVRNGQVVTRLSRVKEEVSP